MNSSGLKKVFLRMVSEFETERSNLMQDLTLLEDHGFGKAANCPYCMEKHSSKIAGYAFEIAAGAEGDEKVLTELGDKAQEWQKRCNILKQTHDEKEFWAIGEEAREWRRKLQGAHEHHHVACVGANCETKMSAHKHSHEVLDEKKEEN